MKLTGGTHRGRILHAPSDDRTRPTQAKLRQALFNSLQMIIPEARVLDLFSGSGALAFEALSRGASHAVAVESSRAAAQIIRKNADALGVQGSFVLFEEPVERVWPKLGKHAPFDVIFADPPYAGGWETRLLAELPWEELLAEEGTFCLEWGKQKSKVESLPEELPFLVKVREKIYGESVLTTYRKKTS